MQHEGVVALERSLRDEGWREKPWGGRRDEGSGVGVGLIREGKGSDDHMVRGIGGDCHRVRPESRGRGGEGENPGDGESHG